MLMCPRCGSKRLVIQTPGGTYKTPAVLRCACDGACPMRFCLACHFESHRQEFEAMANKPPTAADSNHPTQNECNPFPTDQHLRNRRFVLEARRGKGEPVWRRFENGQWVRYTQSEAVAIADEEVLREVREAGLI